MSIRPDNIKLNTLPDSSLNCKKRRQTRKKRKILQWNPLHQLHTPFPPHSNNRIPQSLSRKPRFAIAEVILSPSASHSSYHRLQKTHLPLLPEDVNLPIPHLLMLKNKRRSNPRLEIRLKLLPPKPQSLRVMTPDIFYLFHD